MSAPMPGLPVQMSVFEYFRNYLLLFYDIELPEIYFSPKPEIIPKGKIAFAVIPDYDYGSIYIANVDGKNITLFIKDIRIRGDIAWSPDGKEIAFVGPSPLPVDSRIYTVNMQGKIRILIQFSQMRVSSPLWSPDGKYIAFEATSYQKIEGDTTGMSDIRIGNTFYAEMESSIYLLNADGTNITKIMEDTGQPSWSPDGKNIIFVSYRESNYGNIQIMNIDGTNITTLVKGNYPAWSPNGKEIAFVSWIGDTKKAWSQQIFVINSEGGNLTMLTNFRKEELGEYNILKPTYSPNGQKIAFTIRRSRDAGKGYYTPYFELYINSDGTNLTKLAIDNIRRVMEYSRDISDVTLNRTVEEVALKD